MKKLRFLSAMTLLLACSVQAQVLIGTDGGTNTVGSSTISWSMGEAIIGTAATPSGAMTQGFQQPHNKIIYYSRATGNVSDPIWSRTRTGTPGPAPWAPNVSMVVQLGDVVTNTSDVNVQDVDVELGGSMVLADGSTFHVYGATATYTGSVFGEDNSVLALVGPRPTVLTAASKPNLWDLDVNTPLGTVVNGEVDIRGTLQLDDGTFDASSASINLRSFAASTGRLGPVSPTASYIGSLIMERYIPGGATNWRLLGSAVAGRTVADWNDDFFTAGFPGSNYPPFYVDGELWPSIRYYDETDPGPSSNDGLMGVSGTGHPLAQGQGFAVWSGDALGGTSPFVVDVTGPPHVASSPIAIPLTWTDTGDPLVDGWNLVSNPLPSAVAFDQLNLGSNVERYITYYNPAFGNSAVYDVELALGTNGATNTIQSSQAFWLKTNGPDITASVQEAHKVDDNGGGLFGGLQQDETPRLSIQITSAINNYRDETFVVFDIGDPGLEEADVLKLGFAHASAPQVSTLTGEDERLAINTYGVLDPSVNIPIAVKVGISGTYTLTINEIAELDLACIGLEDLQTGTITPLVGTTTYSFSISASDPELPARFRIHSFAPVAAFTTASTVEIGTPIAFTNTSTGATTATWDFGDGAQSTALDPEHTYTSSGTYTVTLTAVGLGCSDQFTQQVVVTSPGATLNARMVLQGPYDPSTGLMSDALRLNGLVPLTEPYTGLGYDFVSGGVESTTAAVLGALGNDAIVDWVVVELRDAANATVIMESRSALLQRDGDVVDTDGTSPIVFYSLPGDYHVALLHRNHLAVMTRDPFTLGTAPITIHLSSFATPAFGTDARNSVVGAYPAAALWCGDVTFDGVVKYTGASNDRDPILSAIGGSVPTATITGYHAQDVNLDGVVKYTGANNDRDPILQTIGGSVPTAIRVEQVP